MIAIDNAGNKSTMSENYYTVQCCEIINIYSIYIYIEKVIPVVGSEEPMIVRTSETDNGCERERERVSV